jgi:5-methylcytosine-specific restriction endonuclease McrA
MTFNRKSSLLHSNQKHRRRSDLPFTLEQLRHWLLPQLGQACCYCSTTLTVLNLSLDHAHPISRGGNWDLDNLRACCHDCNQAKGELTDIEFKALLRALHNYPTARKNVIARLRAGGRRIHGR